MQNRGISSLLAYLRRELPLPGPELLPDGELLTRFVETKDEAAFELLVRRHGPMVFGVARRQLRDEHAAEDVLQATFLALARQAKSMERQPSIAGWLYRVAVRISYRARRKSSLALPTVKTSVDPSTALEEFELKTTLDSAIDRLPEKLRRAVVLCYVSGHSTEEASRLLNCPKGTVLSRLAAAREKLQTELNRKGIAVSAATLTATLTTEMSSAALPAALVAIAMKAAGPVAALTPIVITLAQGAITMSWIKVTLASVVIVTAGLGLAVGMAGPGPQPPAENPKVADNRPSQPIQAPNRPPEPELDNTPPFLKMPLYTIGAGETEITRLLKDRANCAIRELKLRYEEFQVGRGTLDICLGAARRLQKARLDLTTNANERGDINKQYLEVIRSIDTLNEQRFNSGAIKEQDFLQSHYLRLEAEIEILREQAKQDGGPVR
jgi:RNA polymerase sigma factor (sigma-70 family)